MPQISPKAIVAESAVLADDAIVGAFCFIGPHVRIEPGCVIANNVTIDGRTTLGNRTRVFPMAVIGVSPDGGEATGECVLGEANAIREHVTIYGGAEPPTRIGNHNLIMIGTQIGAGAAIGDHGIFDNCTRVGDGAAIDDYVRMSGFASVSAGVKVGGYSFVAGYAEVTCDAPPYAMLQGSPVRVRGVNTRNLKACGFDEEDIHALKSTFRELFNGPGGEVNAKVLKRLARDSGANPHVRKLVEAIQAAQTKGPADE